MTSKELGKGCLTGGLVIFVIIIIVTVIANVSDDEKVEQTKNTESAQEQKDVKNWHYSSSINEMDDRETYFAHSVAEKKLQFKFPYDGGTTVTLTLRNKDGKNEVMLSISQGQFMPNLLNNHLQSRWIW